ncbi:sugar transporter domain-containing protein [Ditylenchus destructor]|nr:sugar transporter domain-containing protein [Ditylenchus destructor]
MSHRKVKNPGFSHGHNWLTATVFQACDTSFCSSKRSEHTGKVSDPTKLPSLSHRNLENPGFYHGHNWLTATVFQACDTSFCSSKRSEHTGKRAAVGVWKGVLVVGRVFAPMFSPRTDTDVIMYLQEISPSNLRGSLSCLFATGYFALGLLGIVHGIRHILGHSLARLFPISVGPGILKSAMMVCILFACVLTYLLCYGLAVGPISYFITPELLPIQNRSNMFCKCFSISSVLIVITNFATLPFYELIDPVTFVHFFVIRSVFSLIYIYIYLPETKNKDTQEIVDALKCNSNNRSRQNSQFRILEKADLNSRGPSQLMTILPNLDVTEMDNGLGKHAWNDISLLFFLSHLWELSKVTPKLYNYVMAPLDEDIYARARIVQLKPWLGNIYAFVHFIDERFGDWVNVSIFNAHKTFKLTKLSRFQEFSQQWRVRLPVEVLYDISTFVPFPNRCRLGTLCHSGLAFLRVRHEQSIAKFLDFFIEKFDEVGFADAMDYMARTFDSLIWAKVYQEFCRDA